MAFVVTVTPSVKPGMSKIKKFTANLLLMWNLGKLENSPNEILILDFEWVRLYSKKTPGFYPWVGKIPWRRAWQPTSVFFLRIPMDRGAWWATVQSIGSQRVGHDRSDLVHMHGQCHGHRMILRIWNSLFWHKEEEVISYKNA